MILWASMSIVEAVGNILIRRDKWRYLGFLIPLGIGGHWHGGLASSSLAQRPGPRPPSSFSWVLVAGTIPSLGLCKEFKPNAGHVAFVLAVAAGVPSAG